MQKIIIACLFLITIGIFKSNGQATVQDKLQTITTAVPFLNITPDARAGGMGDVGAATTPDANATYWNPAKLAFAKNTMGAAVSYNPWLRKLVNDMSLSYLSGYKKLRKEDAIGVSLKYFNLGQVTFTDNSGNVIRTFQPTEFAIGTDYSRMLSKRFSMGLGLKYFNSNLTGGFSQQGSGTVAKAVSSVSADIGAYYTKDMLVQGRNSNLSLGLVITDIGPKVTYTDVTSKQYIPTNMRLGGTYTIETDPFNKFSLSVDANKYLVPSAHAADSAAGFVSAMYSSFGDTKFKNELNEVILCMGAEYWYTDIFAIRGGYHYENPQNGNRRYVNCGIGIRYQVFGLDMAYLIPIQQSNPLAETLRFTLHFNFAEKQQKAPEGVQE
jgi:hypothetical protein